jgi:RHS repeat-associated protein
MGSTRQTVTETGTVAGSARYDAWGVPLENTTGSRFGFTGELTDNGLVYLRARWYNPNTGTFTSRDPFPGVDTVPQSLHPYAYTHNNPVNATDPSGMSPGKVTEEEGRLIGEMIETDFINNVAPSLGYQPGQITRQHYVPHASKVGLELTLHETNNGFRLEIQGTRTFKHGRLDLIDFVREEIYEIKSVVSEAKGRAELYWYLSFKPGYKPGSIQYNPSPRDIGPWPTDPNYIVRAENRQGVIVYWGVKKDSKRGRSRAPAVDPFAIDPAALGLLIGAGAGAILGGAAGRGGIQRPQPRSAYDCLPPSWSILPAPSEELPFRWNEPTSPWHEPPFNPHSPFY